MKQSLGEFFNVLLSLFKTLFKKRVILLVEPHHPNLGDLAQLMCTREWIRTNFPKFKLIEVGQFFAPFDNSIKAHFLNFDVFKLLSLKMFVRKDDLLIGHSGYFFVDHHTGWFAYELILKYFHNNCFLILPQTINFYDPFVVKRVKNSFSNHPNLTLLCRDEVSYQKATELFSGIKISLYPDIVTSLIGCYHFNNKREGVLFCLRDDTESYYRDDEINAFISKLGSVKIERVDTTLKGPRNQIEKNSRQLIFEMIEMMSTFQVVITDRYHGTIFSAIASTPVIVISSNDHKLSSGVNWFPKEIFGDMVQFAENLDQALKMTKDICGTAKKEYNNPPYLRGIYWEKALKF